MLVAASRVVIGLIGAVLLYVALFLRETEEGKLQNRLEKLWIDIDDLSKAALSKQTAFLQKISALASSILSKLFGIKLFSAEAAAASVCFSISSVLMFGVVKQAQEENAKSSLTMLAVAIGSFMLGRSPTPFRYLGFLWIPGSLLFTLWADWSRLKSNWTWWVREDFLIALMVLGGGFLSDILFIAISRWCLRKSSELTSGWRIASLVTLNGCIGLVLTSPLIWSAICIIRGMALPEGQPFVGLAFLAMSNLVAGVIAFLFILFSLVALLHLAFWPILERPIYSLQRFGVARNPKLVGATSITCLLFAWPNSPIVQAIAKLVHG